VFLCNFIILRALSVALHVNDNGKSILSLLDVTVFVDIVFHGIFDSSMRLTRFAKIYSIIVNIDQSYCNMDNALVLYKLIYYNYNHIIVIYYNHI